MLTRVISVCSPHLIVSLLNFVEQVYRSSFKSRALTSIETTHILRTLDREEDSIMRLA